MINIIIVDDEPRHRKGLANLIAKLRPDYVINQFKNGNEALERTIPKELDEAARIDGANHFTIYSRIILPLSKPSLIVVGLFSFMGSWNDFLGPLVYLNDSNKFTLSLGLMQFNGMYTAQWQYMMAASAVVVLPIVIIFFLGQKYFIEGIAMTGMKG